MSYMYCEPNEKLASLMIPVCEFEYSKIFFFKDQKNPGRCVVQFKPHKDEYFEMTKEERDGYFREFALVAKAIYQVYKPQKINYATYGDLVSHLHMHVVPKYEGGLSWGGPFVDTVERVELTEEEYAAQIATLREAIIAVEASGEF